jgi:hypothetical protein
MKKVLLIACVLLYLSDVERGNERGNEGRYFCFNYRCSKSAGLNLQMLCRKEKSLRRFNKGRYGCMDG